MKQITLIISLLLFVSGYSQSIYNPQQIGQTGRNQSVSRGFWVKSDTALFNSKIWIPLGSANGKVLTSDSNGFATWQTASGGVGYASNGLSVDGDSTVLGGALTRYTDIQTNGNDIQLFNTDSSLFLNIGDNGILGDLESFDVYFNNRFAVEAQNKIDFTSPKSEIAIDTISVSSKSVSTGDFTNYYAKSATDSGFNTSMSLTPKNTTWSLNNDTMSAGVSNIKSTDGTGFFTNMYVGKNDLASSPGDKMRISCSYHYDERLAHVEAAYIDRDFNGPSTLNHISAFQSGLYLAFNSTNSDDLASTGFCYNIDSTFKARWLYEGDEIASIDTLGNFTANNYNSGTYNPTVYNDTNITSATATDVHWFRTGDMVTVSGRATIAATTNGVYQISLSLPVASNFTDDNDANGVGSSAVHNEYPLYVHADVTNDRLSIHGDDNSTSAHIHYFTATYIIK